MSDLIDRKALIEDTEATIRFSVGTSPSLEVKGAQKVIERINKAPTVDAVEVVHGHWIYEAHKEYANYRWNVTAQCSECGEDKGEIWAGFFPGIPDDIAESVALQSAESVKISNYCPNCGSKMDGERKEK